MESNTYAAAGVDVAAGERFVDRLKVSSKRQGHEQLWRGCGSYASIVPINQDLAMALTTDGVGTKLLTAVETGKLDTVGIDLVAMCANDLICVGATPSSFLDYYATPKLNDAQADAIIKGIIEGCDRAGILLVGGETAELPGLYAENHFDLAGFAAGTVTKQTLITGEKIKAGDTVLGVASAGIHSNGFSLARKLIKQDHPLFDELLLPTAVYVRPAVELLQRFPQQVKGLAHITGGGWRNMFRMKEGIGFVFSKTPPLPPVLQAISKSVDPEEMYKTFNMGLGLAIVISGDETEMVQIFRSHGFASAAIGKVTDDAGTMTIHAEPQFGRKLNLVE
jgi:phosphoribosylformylglycinamidine cyclo-ligase